MEQDVGQKAKLDRNAAQVAKEKWMERGKRKDGST